MDMRWSKIVTQTNEQRIIWADNVLKLNRKDAKVSCFHLWARAGCLGYKPAAKVVLVPVTCEGMVVCWTRLFAGRSLVDLFLQWGVNLGANEV